MELENIVANTVYLKARESEITKSGGRSKKWKDMLALPHVSSAAHLRDQIPLNLYYIYKEQPIGRLLFRQFCENYNVKSSPANVDQNQADNLQLPEAGQDHSAQPPKDPPPNNTYMTCIQFLDAKEEYDVAEPEERWELGHQTIEKFLRPQSKFYIFKTENGLNPVLNESNASFVATFDSADLTPERMTDAFNTAYKLVFERLATTPFQEFLLTKYFDRYLQFKFVEQKPVDKVDFRMYRVLGKGGFGEVNACQHRPTGKMYACKSMLKKRIKKRGAQRMTLDEKRILMKINSRFVVSLAYAFQTKDSLCLILTLMNGGDLKFHIQTLIEIRNSSLQQASWSAQIPTGEDVRGRISSFATSLRKRSSALTSISSFFDTNVPTAPPTKPGKGNDNKQDDMNLNVPVLTSNATTNPDKENIVPDDTPGSPQRKSLPDRVIEPTIIAPTVKNLSPNVHPPQGQYRRHSSHHNTHLGSGDKATLSLPTTVRHAYTDPGPGGFDLERARFYAAEVCCGLIHMHNMGIIYRDIKPENILLDDQGHVRISDLGLAVQLKPETQIRGRVGTVGYMAPEILLDDYYAFSIDWWSMGCMIYEMIEGKTPFRGYKERVQKSEINKRSLRDQEISYSHRFDVEARDICNHLLKKNPRKRLGARNETEEILDHPFFSRHYNMARLEAGKYQPEFVPDPRAVYAKDILDIDQFSSVKGVTLNDDDDDFHTKFDTGAVSIPWQTEMIETHCFEELNVFSKRNPDSAEVTHSDYVQAATGGLSPQATSFRNKFSFRRHPNTAPNSPEHGNSERRPSFFKALFTFKHKSDNEIDTLRKIGDSPESIMANGLPGSPVKQQSLNITSVKNSPTQHHHHIWSKLFRFNLCNTES